MKIFGKKKTKATVTAKELEKQLDARDRQHEYERRELQERYHARLCSYSKELDMERHAKANAVAACEKLTKSLIAAQHTIEITAQSMTIEQAELETRAARLSMRIQGLGVVQ